MDPARWSLGALALSCDPARGAARSYRPDTHPRIRVSAGSGRTLALPRPVVTCAAARSRRRSRPALSCSDAQHDAAPAPLGWQAPLGRAILEVAVAGYPPLDWGHPATRLSGGQSFETSPTRRRSSSATALRVWKLMRRVSRSSPAPSVASTRAPILVQTGLSYEK